MSKKIRVLMKRPDSDWYTTYISDSLENLQNTVGGYIETVTITDSLVVVCNEEGRIHGLEHNTTLLGVDFVGTIFVCGVDGDEFADCEISLKVWKALISSYTDGGCK